MMADLWSGIWTIARKDLTEWFSGRGGSIAGLGAVLGMVVAFGVLVPLIGGAYWLAEPWHLLIWAWLPMFLMIGSVADSIAGERERHTFETLLSTRLSPAALVLGKALAAILYGWGATMLCFGLALATLYVAHLPAYPMTRLPEIGLTTAWLALLIAILTAAGGMLISLRAASVRNALQMLTIMALVIFLGANYLAPLLFQWMAPQWLLQEPDALIPLAGVALALLDLVLLALVVLRFRQREWLVD
jgi:ABC-2 type transport system permease protein